MKITKIVSAISAVTIAVSALTYAPAFAATAISDEAGFASAISSGGDYELSADISAANAGINTSPSTGTIDGKGYMITKSNSKWGDAVLYQNCNGNWTFSDMTIDGNKSTGTFTDAAVWYMAGTVKFDNVTMTADDTAKSVSFAGSDVKWALNAEKTKSSGGRITVSATALNFTDENRDVSVYAAVYNDNALASVDVSHTKIQANGLSETELTLNASDTDTVWVYLWDNATMEPLADKLPVTEVKEENIILSYDFENPSYTAALLSGGAYIESGKGISGNGLKFDGKDGYMQLPNDIMTDSITFIHRQAEEWSRV